MISNWSVQLNDSQENSVSNISMFVDSDKNHLRMSLVDKVNDR